ncbi:hypothetical protein BJ122_103178 [Rhodopseudomonas faecalis]|uniref:Uncharacterized protein n=1 Tax=Rhodopseudomonas faecalis TaxID=99655 RepID=A0A318TIK8_9BRAD|nr:hypothetical protein [Rhodopseudomonas faecalis]PYF04524.1 hypothetical protein BJ122_103178 [Rhodopseudomonas faecalis]TAH67839.1 MAG: hypothetical protein EWM45_06520 [Rhodopseudomonas palustris]
MMNRTTWLAGAALLCTALLPPQAAQALTAQECSAKYQAAKAAGTLGDKSWNDFRKSDCADAAAAKPEGKADDAKSEAQSEAKSEPTPEMKPEAKPDTKADAKTGAKPDAKPDGKQAAAKPAAAPGAAVFPTAIDPKYAEEKPARARLHTCADQWKINKANNTTGGLRWIQKGGGYWSQCNKKLKGA